MRRYWFFLATLVALQSCVTIEQGGTLTQFGDDVARLQSLLELNPDNADAARDLGVIYYRVSDFAKAAPLLRKALAINERDAKARFYLGMTLEGVNDTEAALGTYVNYQDYSALSPYRRLMQGRFQALSREVIKRQFRELIAREASLGASDADTAVLAVFPLRFIGGEEKYAAIGTGLSELLTVDLGQVSRVRLVERVRVDELLDELALSRSAAFDEATTARVGKLLKAGNVVGGTCAVSSGDVVRADLSPARVGSARAAEPVVRSEVLAQFFRLEKALAFDLLARIGVEPTPVERERIERIPTRSLQAFLLYSIGLERERTRDYIAARSYYRSAVSADPKFQLAADRAERMEAFVVAGSLNDARRNALAMDADPARRLKDDVLRSRLDALLANLGAVPLPGIDQRSAPADAYRAPAPILPLLPPPPPPR
jgi:tetratricopeptide (TPR) repeat protein